MPHPRFRRRQYVVDKRFQLRFTLMFALPAGLLGLTLSAILVDMHLEQSALLGIQSPWDASMVLCALFGLLVLIVLGIGGVLLSHRVAGPIFVAMRHLRSIRAGHYPHMRALREHDQLTEFYELFRNTITVLRERDLAEAVELEKLLATAQLPDSVATDLKAIAARKRDRAAQS